MTNQITLLPGEGRRLQYLGSEITLKAVAKDSGGLLSALEIWVPAGGHGPLPHVHNAHDETWYVLEGEFTVGVNQREQVVRAGSFLFIPRGETHTYSNSSGEPAKVLCFFTPAGYEQCYEEIARTFPGGEPQDLADILPIMRRYDTEPAGTAIILFVDIADSTALTEQMGDALFRAKTRDLDARLRSTIREGAGTPIEGKLLGDGVLATFASASHAIVAALACAASGDEARLPLHVGLHAGDVIREEGNVFGGAVNIAARISALSAPGEVLVSTTIRDLARTSAGVQFEDRGEQALKGVAEPVRTWAVMKG